MESKQKQEGTEKYDRAGYRIHFDRLKNIRSEISAIRTHKFLCELPNDSDIKEKFGELAKVVDSNEEGSILWFLTQMYGLGFCIARTPQYKRELLRILDPNFKSPASLIQKKIAEINSEKTLKIISPDKLLDFILKGPRQPFEQFEKWEKDSKRLPTFISDTLPIFGLSDFAEAQKDEVLNNLFNAIFQELRKNKGEKFLENLKVIFADFFEIPELSEIKKEDTTTFFFNPYSWEKNGEKINDKNFEIFDALFQNIFPTADFLEEKAGIKESEKELLGTANNQGGLSHFLNLALTEFQKGEGETRIMIEAQNPGFFLKNPELLHFLVKKVSTLAKQLSSATTTDFLAENWGDYRALIGGRLEGWVSNFQNRLGEFQNALADSIHESELNKWGIPNEIRDYLLEKRDDKCFVFKTDLPKDFEKKKFYFIENKTGEIKGEQELEKFRFWGKGNEKGDLQKRRKAIFDCTKNILKRIRDNSDFKNVFPEHFKKDFGRLENLCDPLLIKLRDTVGITRGESADDRDLGKMIDEYFEYWKQVNEFLAKWENEGIPKNITENEIIVWDGKAQKPESLWIGKYLLADKKDKKEDDNETKSESQEILGKLKKSLIPSELPKYPRFLYEAAKDPEGEIFDAAESLPKISAAAEKFVGAIENQQDENWEKENWAKTIKKGETKWHFGQFHKSLEALLKIAVRAKNPKKIVEFLDSFVDWDDAFFQNLIAVRNKTTAFDEQKERQRITEAKAVWKNVIGEKQITQEKLANFHFYLSGKEYGFSRYTAVPTKIVSLTEFLQRFEVHFSLQKGGNFEAFLEIENGGANDNSVTKAELLKFWWARRIHNISEKVTIPDFSADEIFSENVLKILILEKSEISRSDAARFLTAGLGSDIRGKIGLLTRNSFIARNVVQITNGSQTLLQFVPREWGEFNEVQITGKNNAARRRKKLAARSPLEKMEKRIKRTRSNLASLSSENLEYEILKKRIATLEEKIEKVKNQNVGFSNLAKCTLKSMQIDFENRKNMEIADEIWKIFPNQNTDTQRLLAQVLGEMPHSWSAVLKTKMPIENINPVLQGHFFEKSNEKNTFELCTKRQNCYLYTFPIQTSGVQKQFLERFLWGDRDKILTEKIMGASVILETEKIIQWENKAPDIRDGETKMFVAIPFQFSKEKGDKNGDVVEEKRMLGNSEIEITSSERKAQKQYRTETKLLGIDLGEYGFGYAIFDPEKKKFQESGFVEEPLLKKMRDDAASWRDTQSRGIFSRPTTHLADIREKAAGAVRNQIHALALRHNAIPIYEDSVDGFESGGARISKLYKTLKTSDVLGGGSNEVDAAVRKHFWGEKFASIGGVIGASKTSQTCRVCGRCATSEIEELAKGAEGTPENQQGLFGNDNHNPIARKHGKQIVFEVYDNKVVGTDICCNLPNGEQEKSLILTAIKKAQRFESVEEKLHRESGSKKRGTIEKFACQICKNITDCDAQAAKNIALKYFFKITASNEDRENPEFKADENFSSLKYFLSKSKEQRWRNL